jgi:hypothetical protein
MKLHWNYPYDVAAEHSSEQADDNKAHFEEITLARSGSSNV